MYYFLLPLLTGFVLAGTTAHSLQLTRDAGVSAGVESPPACYAICWESLFIVLAWRADSALIFNQVLWDKD